MFLIIIVGSGYAGSSLVATRDLLIAQSQQHAQRRGDKPPKLPPREQPPYPQDIPRPDYDGYGPSGTPRFSMFGTVRDGGNVGGGRSSASVSRDKFDEDPYYAGLRSRVPNFPQQLRGEKPPKLPPRDSIYPHDIPTPDYDDTASNISNNWLKKSFGSSRTKEKTKNGGSGNGQGNKLFLIQLTNR